MTAYFQTLLQEKGINLSPRQCQQFDTYYRQLHAWNQHVNLTAVTEKQEVYLKHFYDSVTLAFYYDFVHPLTLCDVGAGAGFPSLPLKICYPELEVTIIDALQKRVSFLQSLVEDLGLRGVHIYHSRAEAFAKEAAHRASFDVVTARAVAKLSVLSEYCLPLTRTGGHFLAMKGATIDTEVQESKQAIALLGGEIEAVDAFTLPDDGDGRHLIRIKKRAETPASYPRKPGKPNKQPL